MSKKTAKGKKSRPLPKQNLQISNSIARKSTAIVPSDYLLHAQDYPLYGCWIMASWQDQGLTPVVVARQQGPDRVMCAVYMVDLYCLGIKDVFVKMDYSLNRFERDLPQFCASDPIKCSVELAHEIIYGALEYAAKLGFQPHSDYHKQKADLMLDPPDAHPHLDHVSFGKDGKPFFVAGPYDNQQKIKFVLDTLRRTSGEGNFNFVAGLG